MNKNKILNNYLILLTSGFLIEVIFRLINNLNILNFSFLRTFIGINVISIILSLIYSIFPRKVSYVFSSITVLIFSIYSFAQMLFFFCTPYAVFKGQAHICSRIAVGNGENIHRVYLFFVIADIVQSAYEHCLKNAAVNMIFSHYYCFSVLPKFFIEAGNMNVSA